MTKTEELIKAAFALDNTTQSAPQGPPAGRHANRPAGSPASFQKDGGAISGFFRRLFRGGADDAAEAAAKGMRGLTDEAAAKGMRGLTDEAAAAAARQMPETGGKVLGKAPLADPVAEAARRNANPLANPYRQVGPPVLPGKQIPKPPPPRTPTRPPPRQAKPLAEPPPLPVQAPPTQTPAAGGSTVSKILKSKPAKWPGAVIGTTGLGAAGAVGWHGATNKMEGRGFFEMPEQPIEADQIGYGEGQYPPELFTIPQLRGYGYDLSQHIRPGAKPMPGDLGAYQIEKTPRLLQMKYDLLEALAPHEMRRPDFAEHWSEYLQGGDIPEDAQIALSEYEQRMLPLIVQARHAAHGQPLTPPSEMLQSARPHLKQFMGEHFDPMIKMVESKGAQRPDNPQAVADAVRKAQQRYQLLKQMQMAHYFQ